MGFRQTKNMQTHLYNIRFNFFILKKTICKTQHSLKIISKNKIPGLNMFEIYRQ